MTDNRGGAASPASEALKAQAKTLQDAMREAVGTSPNSFLKTLGDVEAKGPDYWINEIQSSTWVLAEQNGKVVGVAACKPPEKGKDEESDEDSRYIESVWIDPRFRRRRLATRLIRYLMAAEFRKNLNIRQFLLWVLETNKSAISLYERMQFVGTGDRHDGFKPEIKYRLVVNPETSAAIIQTVSEVLGGKEKSGVTYRILGEGDSA